MLSPAAMATGAGLLVGAVIARRVLKSQATVADAGRREDADERLSHLVRQLKDLEEQKDRLVPESYEAERAKFEGLASAALKEQQEADDEVAEVTAPPKSGSGNALWYVTGSLVAVALVVTSLWIDQKDRVPEPPARGPMMGGAPSAQNGEIAALIGRLREKPDDVESLVALGRILLRSQMFDQAQVVTERALQYAPEHPVARVHWAVLMAARGQRETALTQLAAIAEKHPKLPDPWFFRGMLSMQAGDQTSMVEGFTKFIELAPDGPRKERIRGMLQRSQGAGMPGPSGGAPRP